MSIQKHDVNFRQAFPDASLDLKWYDIRKAPFQIYGLYKPETEPFFHRMPVSVAEQVNEGVAELERCTSGGRVHFSTNARYIALRMTTPVMEIPNRMPLCGACGFDLYTMDDGHFVYRKTFAPEASATDGFASAANLARFELSEGWHSYCINFPLYNPVTDVEIGVPSDCEIGAGADYRPMKPVVYYGSSTTQGGCASRPGNCYTHVISRRLNLDFVNLGFSGSARGEQAMADYLASLEMSVFVSDYDYNSPNPEHLRSTHYPLYETIRAKHPDLPYLMISRPDRDEFAESTLRMRAVVRESYERAVAAGDKNVYFIDGGDLFAGPERADCTVDGGHPNDLGFRRMADVIGAKLAEMLHLEQDLG